MHGRVRRLGHALDGLRHLPRSEVVNHVPRPPHDLQRAAPDLGREPLGAALEHHLVAVTRDDGHGQVQGPVVPAQGERLRDHQRAIH